MLELFLRNLGWFIVPQGVLSALALGLIFGYVLAWGRGERVLRAEHPWRRTLEPLAALAVTVGLSGSVWGFIRAFEGFAQAVDVERITGGLAIGYWTTLVGLSTSLVASVGCYILDLAFESNKEVAK